MSSLRRVPETRLIAEDELSADHAWGTLRRYGGWRLLREAMVRFRYGDGFSHARALGLQLCLAGVPLLIALHGLASNLGGLRRGGRVVADTVLALTPGASESLVSHGAAGQRRSTRTRATTAPPTGPGCGGVGSGRGLPGVGSSRRCGWAGIGGRSSGRCRG